MKTFSPTAVIKNTCPKTIRGEVILLGREAEAGPKAAMWTTGSHGSVFSGVTYSMWSWAWAHHAWAHGTSKLTISVPTMSGDKLDWAHYGWATMS